MGFKYKAQLIVVVSPVILRDHYVTCIKSRFGGTQPAVAIPNRIRWYQLATWSVFSSGTVMPLLVYSLAVLSTGV